MSTLHEVDIPSWQAKMRSVFMGSVGESEIESIVDAVVQKAKLGDLQAARLLLSYAIGSPQNDVPTRSAPVLVEMKPAVVVPELPEPLPVGGFLVPKKILPEKRKSRAEDPEKSVSINLPSYDLDPRGGTKTQPGSTERTKVYEERVKLGYRTVHPDDKKVGIPE